jgi:hypothetical protein
MTLLHVREQQAKKSQLGGIIDIHACGLLKLEIGGFRDKRKSHPCLIYPNQGLLIKSPLSPLLWLVAI